METAASGKEAVDIFTHSSAQYYYNVILMDMMMPVMNGCTTNAFSDDISKCRAAGMNAHLSKPLNMKTVTKVIRRFT